MNDRSKSRKRVRKVIIFEDNRSDLRLYNQYLKSDKDNIYDIQTIDNPMEQLDKIDVNQADIIILNSVLHSMSGLEILHKLTKGDPITNPVPAIMITSFGDESIAAECVKMGAQDYIPKKELTPERFLFSIKNTIIKTSVIKRLLDAQEQLKELSIMDALTGIYNRRYFNNALQGEIERALRYKESLCLLILDLDNFKKINDTMGHAAGDKVLQFFAKDIKSRIRSCDILARYGGDEFCLLLPNTYLDPAKKFAMNLLEKFNTKQVNLENGNDMSIKFSIGIADLNERNLTPQKLFEAADKALILAKQSGKNTFQVAEKTGSNDLLNNIKTI